jgi:uncharacterized protein YaaW (UPF0174 family)
MGYEITDILSKATKLDAQFIVEILSSYFSFTDDKGMREALDMWENGPIPELFAKKLEKEIRYVGSNEIATFFRYIIGRDPAGVSFYVVVSDVAKALKVKIKHISTIEKTLETLGASAVQHSIYSMSIEEQIKLIKSSLLNEEAKEKVLKYIRDNKIILSLPIIKTLLGTELFKTLLNGIIGGIIKSFLGKFITKKTLELILARLPLNFFGPVSWLASGAVTLHLIFSPALRKTMPIVLHLSRLCIKDNTDIDITDLNK